MPIRPLQFGRGNKLIDLSAFHNITRLEFRGPLGGLDHMDARGDGIGWDDFHYTFVPAPGSLALLALAGVAARRRR